MFWIFGKLNCRLSAMLANFGFSKNIQNFRNIIIWNMDHKFPGNNDFLKIKKVCLTPHRVSHFWICGHFNFRLRAVLACAESDSAQAKTVQSHWFREYLRENKFLSKTILTFLAKMYQNYSKFALCSQVMIPWGVNLPGYYAHTGASTSRGLILPLV